MCMGCSCPLPGDIYMKYTYMHMHTNPTHAQVHNKIKNQNAQGRMGKRVLHVRLGNIRRQMDQVLIEHMYSFVISKGFSYLIRNLVF